MNCVKCGQPAKPKKTQKRKQYTRRLRHCPGCGCAFWTYQNGAGEVFDCYALVSRQAKPYGQMQRVYLSLAKHLEGIASDRAKMALERARQKAGVSRLND